MDQVRFDYSTKNIPIPPRNSYLKSLIEKVESAIKRMRWKAFFFDRNDQDNKEATNNNNSGFKSRKCPPQNSELDKFEADLLDMVHNIKFRNVNNKFQNKLNEDISKIKKSTKAFISADKTSNFYKLDKTQHDKLLRDSITTTYKKANTDAANIIDSEATSIAQELNIDDRTEQIAKQQAFITLKDHKDNFANHPTCRLINPAKNELGKVSKQILDNINSTIRKTTKLNQWKNTSDVTNWFTSIPDMQKHSFGSFDIDSFYPSITESLLSKAISFAKNYTTIRDKDIDIIMHCRKSLLFDKETAWTKKNHSDMFDVAMGSFDGAEVCELIGLFLLNILSEKYGKNNVGLYRDDGLVLLRNASGPQSERTRKDITREFKKRGLNISIKTNLKICNFLDVTLNLSDGTYYPYRKPNNETLYIDSNSNHPPTIIKHLPAAIGRRISDISSSKELFNQAKPHYESALKQGGHDEKLMFTERKKPATHTTQNSRKNRQRNTIWFNPPYSMNIQTNIGREFLNLVDKHFPKNHRYNKIFNKNNIKVSYSCTDNLQTIIKKHNRKILETSKKPSTEKNCNCRKKNDCPLKNNCLTSSVVYNANVTTESDTIGKNYIGLTKETFKQRYTQHKLSFRNRNYSNSTELSKHIWTLKVSNTNFTINWSILATAPAYSNKTKRCHLCLTEKLYLIRAKKPYLLNKRSELISKCRHENNFYLANFTSRQQ